MQTTALRKIAGLKSRIWGVQGGQGAGKTFAILILIINFCTSNAGKECYVISAELSKMRDTVLKDFIKILKMFNLRGRVKLGGVTNGSPICLFPNGSFIRFIGLDKEDSGKGLRSDLVFANEGNKLSFDAFREFTSRTKKIIIDFNPNKRFWYHTEVETEADCQTLILTFRDNEFLSEAERKTILSYRKKGYDENGKVINQYWANMWQVYGEGKIGQVEGRIYTWKSIGYADYLMLDTQTYYGCDWGKVDPWAIVEVKYIDGNLYVHELNYSSENVLEQSLPSEHLAQIRMYGSDEEKENGLVPYIFNKNKIPYDKIIVCDNNRPSKTLSLRRAGWEYAVAVGGKMDLLNRISVLSNLNIFYTSSSKNIELEQENYCYDKDRFGVSLEVPKDKDNHAMDAIAYAVQYLFAQGIIKNV